MKILLPALFTSLLLSTTLTPHALAEPIETISVGGRYVVKGIFTNSEAVILSVDRRRNRVQVQYPDSDGEVDWVHPDRIMTVAEARRAAIESAVSAIKAAKELSDRSEWRAGLRHQTLPNISTTAEFRQWKPDPGYRFISRDSLAVKWTPGAEHGGDYPNVIAATSEGKWRPAPGYKWLIADTFGKVVWSAGQTHPTQEGVISEAREGWWLPMPGYVFVNPGKPDLTTRWVPGTIHTDDKRMVSAEVAGTWRPASGYRWADPATRVFGAVVWAKGQRHAVYHNAISSETEGKWRAAVGYAFDDPAKGLATTWQAGSRHPLHPLVVADKTANLWLPAKGYEWVDADVTSSLAVRPKGRLTMAWSKHLKPKFAAE